MVWRFKDERGITLVEILVVVFIISTILSIAVPNYTKSAERAKEKICDASVTMINAQIQLYLLDKDPNEEVPSVWGELEEQLIDLGYLKERASCPSGGTYELVDGVIKCDLHPADISSKSQH